MFNVQSIGAKETPLRKLGSSCAQSTIKSFCALSLILAGCDGKKNDSSDQGEIPPDTVVSGQQNVGETDPAGLPQSPIVSPSPTPPPPPVPMIQLSERPADNSFIGKARFAFDTVNFSATSYECSFDAATYSACSSPQTVESVAAGQHTFKIKALNGADSISTTYAWTVDGTVSKLAMSTSFPGGALIRESYAKGNFIAVASNQGLLISEDGGKTLRIVNTSNGLASNSTSQIQASGAYLFVSTAGGLVILTNNAATVVNKTTANGLLANYLSSVFFDKNSSRLYASHLTGISYSDDFGSTFTTKSSLIGVPSSNISWLSVAESGKVFVLTDANKIYSSNSIDGTFVEITGLAGSLYRFYLTPSGKVFAATSSGVFISADNGLSFTQRTTANGLPANNSYGVLASDDGSIVIVGSSLGYAVSKDGGNSFSAFTLSGATNNYVTRLHFDDSGRLLMSDEASLYRSTNLANSFALQFSDSEPPEFVASSSPIVTHSSVSGVSISWDAAIDNTTSSNALTYEVFKGSDGIDFSDLEKIYLTGSLVGRYTNGIQVAPVTFTSNSSIEIAVVVKDASGNKTAYSPVGGATAGSLPAQTWAQTSSNAGAGDLVDHRVVSLSNQLYLVGGIDMIPGPGTVQNKVFRSADGVTWVEVGQVGSFAERFGHGMAEMGGKLWVAAGYGADISLRNDVGFSTDGATWTTSTGNAGFSPRSGAELVSFKGKLFVIGGNAGSGAVNDVWSSADGVTWVRETADAGFNASARPTVIAKGDFMYFLGEGLNQSVWRSADGAHWQQLQSSWPLGSIYKPAAAVLNDKIYLLGGSGSNAGVWSSTDGILWENLTAVSNFPGRDYHAAAAFNNKLWIFQGNSSGYKNDVWSGQ